MLKRLFWFSSGAATGAAGSVWVRRRLREAVRRFSPGGMRERAMARAQRLSAEARVAVNEGRRIARGYRDRNRHPGT